MTTATAAAAETAVKVSTTPIFPEIPLGQARKDFQVLLRVEAPPPAAHRAPVDIVAVLDVSGSMNDPEKQPSKLGLVKAAAKFMVAKLDDGDRLSIVAFNDRPVKELSSAGLLYMSRDGRRNAMNVIDKLDARGGGTALWPALEEAVKVLDGRPGGHGSRDRLGFILLLTDGEGSSRWRRERESIHGFRYPVHSFGLGAAHDPEALLHIAQESHGTCSFVDDENVDKIPGAIAVCLGGLTTVAAVDTRVVLKAGAELDGVRIDRVDSGGYGSRVSCGGAACEVAVGALYAGEAKHFVVHLHVPAAASSAAEDGGDYYCGVDLAACDRRRRRHEQNLLAVGYSYSLHPGAPAITAEAPGVFVQRSPELLGGAAAGRQALLLPSPEVLHHIVRFELLDVVAGLVHGGGELKDGGEMLQLMWEEFRACHQFWAGLDLGFLETEVEAMVASLRTGKVAYVHATYLTPAMRLLLEEALKLTETTTAGSGGTAEAHYDSASGCVDMPQVIDRRLELWSKVRRDVQHLMFQPAASAVDGDEHLQAAVFQEASLEAIDRAMHRDIYLAVVYASKKWRCHSVASM
ncbi:hypothetical protein EJB05_33505, partial [Eragrostis curvula]